MKLGNRTIKKINNDCQKENNRWKFGGGNEKLLIATIMVLSFLFHIVVLNQLNCWFSTDTDGYWLHAASFAGYRWGDVAKNMGAFYSWGYSVLLTIPMMLSKDPVVRYKIAVLINVVLCTLLVPIVYRFSKKVAPDVARVFHLFIALVVSCYSTYILESAVSLAETTIYFLSILIIYLLYTYFETHKLWIGVLCGFAMGYLYIVHNRCIGMLIAYVIVVMIYGIKRRKWKELIALLLPVVLMFILKEGVQEWLKGIENTDGVYTSNTYGAMATKASRLTFYGILSMIKNALGEVWYTLIGTLMIAGFGLMEIITNRLPKRQEGTGDDTGFLYLYGILSWIFMIGISSFFFMRSKAVLSARMDAIIYGRYMEPTLGLFLIMGLIYLVRDHVKNKKVIGLIIGATALLSILIAGFEAETEASGVNWFSIVAILMPFSYGKQIPSVIESSIVLGAVGLFVLYIFNMRGKGYKLFSLILITGTFLFVGYNATSTISTIYAEIASVENDPLYNDDFLAIRNYLEEREIENVCVMADRGYDAFSYQFLMPDVKVVSISDETELEEIGGNDMVILSGSTIITQSYTVLYEGQSAKLVEINGYEQ